MTDARAIAWANGFGVWHVRVPAGCVSPLIAARRALRDEITAREAGPGRDAWTWRPVWIRPVRVPELDRDDTLVYRERCQDDD